MPKLSRPRVLVALSIAMVIGAHAGPVQADSPPQDGPRTVAGPSERPRGDALADAMALRAALGLPADQTSTIAPFLDGGARAYGLVLTAPELAAVEGLAAAQARTEALLQVTATDPDVVTTHYEGATLHVAVSGDARVLRAALRDGPARTGDIVVRRVERSRSMLEGIVARLATDLPALRAQGIHVVEFGIDPASARVEVAVQAGGAPAPEGTLEERYGDGLIVRVEDWAGELLACDVTSCGTRGGLAARVPGVAACTTGFVAKDIPTVPYAPTYQMVTAGHCIRTAGGVGSGPWRNGALSLTWGTSTRQYFHDMAVTDAGRFGLGSNVPSVRNSYYVGGGSVVGISARMSDAGQAVGKVVCRHGVVSGYGCGVIRATERRVVLSGTTIQRLWKVQLRSQHGDSGAGFIHQPAPREPWQAAGILSGGSYDGTTHYTWYGTVLDAERYVGHRTCTTPSC
jgi:hypothetical protein